MPPLDAQRRRARQACTHCNARRVKCNVTERSPCDNCVAAGASCELRVSRRGKHPRHRPGQAPKQQQNDQSPPQPPAAQPQPQPPAQSQPHSRSPLYQQSLPQVSQLDLQQHQQHHHQSLPTPSSAATDSSVRSRNTVTHTPAGASPPDDLPSLGFRSEHTTPNDDEMSQASHALASLSRGVHPESKPDVKPDVKSVDNQSYGASVFFGESSSIRYFGTDNFAASVAKVDLAPSQAKASRAQIGREEAVMTMLKAKPDGAFTLPVRHITTALLQAYFQWFHSFCPIVDEPDVWHQFETGTLSTLLLQSLLFIATSHCEDSVLADGQLGTRTEAKTNFFTRARDLYDADVEHDSLVVMQSLLLISFWRSPTAQEKDTRYWIGAAISMAQRRGLHRSRNQGRHAPDARVPDRLKKLGRRVWWSIYLHERQMSSMLGLPQRVRDEECDVEPLEPADFELAFAPTKSQEDVKATIDYTISMTKLSAFLGKVVDCVYRPNKASTKAERAELAEELTQWKQSLPPAMRIEEDIGSQPNLHTSMLHMAYNNIIILLYRNCFTDYIFDQEGQNAQQAAARTARLIEDMLPRGIIRHSQFHVLTNLSNTLCITAMEMRSAKGTARTIAEHRSKVCLLAVQELQHTWEFRNWLLQLFFRYLDGPAADRQPGEEGDNRRVASKMGTPLQASYGTAMSRDNSNFPTNASEFQTMCFSAMGELTRDMDPMPWPVDEMERFLFSQIYDSNPFW